MDKIICVFKMPVVVAQVDGDAVLIQIAIYVSTSVEKHLPLYVINRYARDRDIRQDAALHVRQGCPTLHS